MVLKLKSAKVISGLAALLLAGLVVGAMAQGSGGPSQAREVAGPSVGPYGQQGELHYFENPAHEYSGGAKEFGPYRLLPAGTKYIPRPPKDPRPATSVEEVRDVARWKGTNLDVPAPKGFVERRAAATVIDGTTIDAVSFAWSSPSGTIYAVVHSVAEDRLPLDVYLTFDDSPIEERPVMIAGYHAIVEQPRSGPAPNVGYVAVYVAGRSIDLHSPDMGQDRLVQVAQELLSRTPPLAGARTSGRHTAVPSAASRSITASSSFRPRAGAK